MSKNTIEAGYIYSGLLADFKHVCIFLSLNTIILQSLVILCIKIAVITQDHVLKVTDYAFKRVHFFSGNYPPFTSQLSEYLSKLSWLCIPMQGFPSMKSIRLLKDLLFTCCFDVNYLLLNGLLKPFFLKRSTQRVPLIESTWLLHCLSHFHNLCIIRTQIYPIYDYAMT